jgi:hypothetical protein
MKSLRLLEAFRFVRLLHPENAPCPMEVTLSGIEMDVRPEQDLKAETPMEVTLLGIVMLVRLVQ